MGPKAHPRCAPLSPPWPPPRWDLGAAATPREGTLGGGTAPPLPLFILEVWAAQYTRVPLLLGAALPLSLLVSRSAWRSPAGVPRSSITTMPLCYCWTESSPTSPSPLAGLRRRRRHRAARVLNAEAPLFGAKIGINRDLNRCEYDSFIRVLATLPLSDLQGYVDALSFPSLLDYSID